MLRSNVSLRLAAPAVFIVALLAGSVPVALRAQDSPPETDRPEEMATPPYTAAQIKEATKVGRKYTFKIEVPDEPAQFQVMEFTAVTAEGATLKQTTLDKDKAPAGETIEDQVTWNDLESHAHFPKDATRMTEEDLTVPAGTFPCKVYRVTEAEIVNTYWFAKTLPGAPIKVEAREGDKVVFTMTLTEHVNP
jgi:hypothetical protein